MLSSCMMETTNLQAKQAVPSNVPHLPGEAGVWVFVFGDMCIFAILFATFLYYRSFDPELYATSRLALNQTFGVVNTILLLSSSWLVATGLRAARLQKTAICRRFFSAALLCGVCFGISKVMEYSEKIAAGISVQTNDFFMFYFILTGLHMFHVLIGIGVLAFLIIRCKQERIATNDLQIIEGGGVFWHMVDLLWIVLFPLLYLLP